MKLDEAIRHAEEKAKEQDKLCKRYDDASGYTRSYNEDIRTSAAKQCERCAEEHRQLAKWLRKYQKIEQIANDKNINGDLLRMSEIRWVIEDGNND